ncbi:uncharacterized protein LOC8264659 isoform X1 [Ricinus communis]|uniref:uncharacterized protein LOC8264659 isoform X1 n=1 Tax=Ricinus communis TaxID=3988 RepID=UPI00201A952C|nr:uncharacterized protein LOC8264659 isoform X1 [Ricinus communis]
MPLLLLNNTLLLLFKFVLSILLSCCFPFMLLLSVLSLPFSCCFIFFWLISKIIVYAEMKAMTFMGRVLLGSSNCIDQSKVVSNYEESNSNKKTDRVIKDRQESVELNSWELPSLQESDEDDQEEEAEEDYVKVGAQTDGERFSSHEKDSWQILVLKSTNREERRPFHEVLSYWRRKEKGEEI